MNVAALHRSRAEAALDLGRALDAVREAGLAIAAEPEQARCYYVLARALHSLARYREALDALRAGLQRAPDDLDLLVLESDILRADRQLEAALCSAQSAARLAPDDPRAHAALGYSYKALAHYDRAISEFRHALHSIPDNAYLLRSLGDTYLDKRSCAEAETHYRAALALEPNDATALNNLGCALLRMGRAQPAAFAFKAAVMLDPTLKVAKQNTHHTLHALMGGAQLQGLGTPVRQLFEGVIAWVLSSFGVGSWVFCFMRQRQARAQLLAQDPQILDVYLRLQADKKAGRI